jgi:hypothetical protein
MTYKNEKPDVVMVDDAHIDNVNLEKAPTVRQIDDYQVLGLSQEDADFYNSFTPKMRKKLMHKVKEAKHLRRHRADSGTGRSPSDPYADRTIPHFSS